MLECLAAIYDQIAKSLSGTDEFPDDDAHQCQTDVDLGGGKEDGDVGREDDAAQNIQSAAAQGADQFLHVRIYLPETGVQADDGAEDGHGDACGDDRPHVGAQPDDE